MKHILFLQIDSPAIMSLDIESGEASILIDGLGGTPDGVQLDSAEGRIFWTNMGNDYTAGDGSIESARLEGSDRRVLVGHGAIVTPKQLVLDVRQKRLYWCDREGAGLWRSRLDGAELTCLVDRSVEAGGRENIFNQCIGIALDIAGQQVLWTQKGPEKGGKGRIFRAGMDMPAGDTAARRSDIELLMDNLPEPIDLELDSANRLLYWTDRGAAPFGNSLNVARLTKEGLTDLRVLCTGFGEAIGLAVDAASGQAFVADLGGQIWRIDLKSGDKTCLYRHGHITGILLQ